MKKETIKIEGMTCSHCQAAAQKELEHVSGMKSVVVDLEQGVAHIEGDYAMEDVEEAVEDAGFSLKK